MLEAVTQQSQPPSGNDEAGFGASVVGPDRIWHETAFESHKNRYFRVGVVLRQWPLLLCIGSGFLYLSLFH
ncbi:uncharacterized protein DS421_11g334410 [Arachis hypogaea]|nr:uncharacterized protein DS421_11g334410 [Arachis hypogaea]